MPPLLQKILTALVGLVATAVALVLVVEAERLFPLTPAADLARQYWQAAGPAGVQVQAQFYLFMLAQQWLLWLVPVAGAVITALFVGRAGDEELSAYLERVHTQQRRIDELEDAARNTTEYWSGAREAFDKLMESGTDIWLVIGRDGRISRGNRAARQFLKVEEPAGHELQQLLPWLPRSPLYAGLGKVLKGEVWRGDVDVPNADAPLHFAALTWPWGNELALWLRDVSALVADTSLLQNAEVLVRQLVEQSPRGVAVLNTEGTYLYVANRFAEVMGLPAGSLKRGDLHAEKFPDFPPGFATAAQRLAAGEAVGNEAERVTINGREEIIDWHLRPWLDSLGRPAGMILNVNNVSELHRLRAQTTEAGERENTLAYSDLLTGLPNRQLFNDRLNMALAVAHRQLGKLALMFLDLDGFKKVNDTLGHDAGDLLLKQVATRIQAQVRTTDTVARLGGDEFTIILSIRDRADAEQVAQKLLKVIREPFDLNGQPANIGTSIGIALFPQDGTAAADLVRKADAAMYEAKQAGKNTHRFATKQITIEG